ncbi:MAG: AbiEi antitoxin N-terminal domain-containing protein, partial [Bdellovibrionaceae bacterium]|nr:AbiEi antitoxin N-terminal domain-containing protein [Pseudobdellovibrionaceae bacterium]
MRKKSIKNKLFISWKDEAVHTYSWFKSQGISPPSIQQCLKNKMIKKLGGGAYIKAKDKLNWQSGLLTAQKELGLAFHVAGQTALEMLGSGHFLKIGKKPLVYIIKREKVRVPIWLKKNNWR